MTPLERAARAMYDNVKPDWDWDDPDAELLRTMYRGNARAAIAAIREPSDSMRDAGANHTTSFAQPGIVMIASGSGEPEIGAEKIYQAMIDAMLEEG